MILGSYEVNFNNIDLSFESIIRKAVMGYCYYFSDTFCNEN